MGRDSGCIDRVCCRVEDEDAHSLSNIEGKVISGLVFCGCGLVIWVEWFGFGTTARVNPLSQQFYK